MNKDKPVNLDDPDNPEWTAEDFARARPADEILPPEAVAALLGKRGRPRMVPEQRKQQVTLRLSPELRAALRGAGWMGRAEKALRREFLKRA